ncbi:hypothetical protein [Longitalea arenae]|uniref:hypothetical protein n=1 Tax=Longitalea arenae TaxID=2812558 RepID=UPI001967E646|nr:hypothetical protein [Longitalea arenae]
MNNTKDIKIMLLSLAIFSIIGGALAFRVNLDVNYCTTLPNLTFACANGLGGVRKCPNPMFGKTPSGQSQFFFYCYTVTNNPNNCNTNTNCQTTISTKFTNDY